MRGIISKRNVCTVVIINSITRFKALTNQVEKICKEVEIRFVCVCVCVWLLLYMPLRNTDRMRFQHSNVAPSFTHLFGNIMRRYSPGDQENPAK